MGVWKVREAGEASKAWKKSTAPWGDLTQHSTAHNDLRASHRRDGEKDSAHLQSVRAPEFSDSQTADWKDHCGIKAVWEDEEMGARELGIIISMCFVLSSCIAPDEKHFFICHKKEVRREGRRGEGRGKGGKTGGKKEEERE